MRVIEYTPDGDLRQESGTIIADSVEREADRTATTLALLYQLDFAVFGVLRDFSRIVDLFDRLNQRDDAPEVGAADMTTAQHVFRHLLSRVQAARRAVEAGGRS